MEEGAAYKTFQYVHKGSTLMTIGFACSVTVLWFIFATVPGAAVGVAAVLNSIMLLVGMNLFRKKHVCRKQNFASQSPRRLKLIAIVQLITSTIFFWVAFVTYGLHLHGYEFWEQVGEADLKHKTAICVVLAILALVVLLDGFGVYKASKLLENGTNEDAEEESTSFKRLAACELFIDLFLFIIVGISANVTHNQGLWAAAAFAVLCACFSCRNLYSWYRTHRIDGMEVVHQDLLLSLQHIFLVTNIVMPTAMVLTLNSIGFTATDLLEGIDDAKELILVIMLCVGQFIVLIGCQVLVYTLSKFEGDYPALADPVPYSDLAAAVAPPVIGTADATPHYMPPSPTTRVATMPPPDDSWPYGATAPPAASPLPIHTFS